MNFASERDQIIAAEKEFCEIFGLQKIANFRSNPSGHQIDKYLKSFDLFKENQSLDDNSMLFLFEFYQLCLACAKLRTMRGFDTKLHELRTSALFDSTMWEFITALILSDRGEIALKPMFGTYDISLNPSTKLVAIECKNRKDQFSNSKAVNFIEETKKILKQKIRKKSLSLRVFSYYPPKTTDVGRIVGKTLSPILMNNTFEIFKAGKIHYKVEVKKLPNKIKNVANSHGVSMANLKFHEKAAYITTRFNYKPNYSGAPKHGDTAETSNQMNLEIVREYNSSFVNWVVDQIKDSLKKVTEKEKALTIYVRIQPFLNMENHSMYRIEPEIERIVHSAQSNITSHNNLNVNVLVFFPILEKGVERLAFWKFHEVSNIFGTERK